MAKPSTRKTSLYLTDNLSIQQVMSVLGYHNSDVFTLPATIQCPFCSNRQIVYLNIQSGAWFYCSSCQFSGDIIEFASKIWGSTSTASTLIRLRENGVDIPDKMLDQDLIDRYDSGIVKYRQSALDQWNECKSTDFRSREGFVSLYHSLDIVIEDDPDKWDRLLSKHIAFCRSSKLRIMFDDNGYKPIITNELKTIKYSDDVLMLAMYDAPNRLNGVLFATDNGNYPGEWGRMVFQGGICSKASSKVKQMGIGFYDAALTNNTDFDNTVFAINDPELAVRVHCKWIRENNSLLPLVVYHSTPLDRTEWAWKGLPEHNWVFWSPSYNEHVISQAAHVNGKVSICDPCTSLELSKIKLWLHSVKKDAKPWRKILNAAIPRLKDHELFNLANMIHKEDGLNLGRSLDEDNLARVEELCQTSYLVKRVSTDQSDHDIIEQNGAWWSNGTLIADVIIRLDEIYLKLVEKHSNVRRVKGRVVYKGLEYPFDTSLEDVYTRLDLVAIHVLFDTKAGIPYFNPKWTNQLYHIARCFSPDFEIQSKPLFNETTIQTCLMT